MNKFCSASFPAPNKTFVEACATDVKLFETLAAECYSLSKEATADKACACWTAPEFTISSEKVMKFSIFSNFFKFYFFYFFRSKGARSRRPPASPQV